MILILTVAIALLTQAIPTQRFLDWVLSIG